MIFKEKELRQWPNLCTIFGHKKKTLLCYWLDMNYGFKRFVALEININDVASHTDVHWGWCVLRPLLCLDFYCDHYEYY